MHIVPLHMWKNPVQILETSLVEKHCLSIPPFHEHNIVRLHYPVFSRLHVVHRLVDYGSENIMSVFSWHFNGMGICCKTMIG